MNADGASEPVDLAMLALFFVPNLLVAEFFIRHLHTRLVPPGRLKWPAVALLGADSSLDVEGRPVEIF